MKAIDSKGKIFGKLHIFDLIFGVLVIAVIIGALSKVSGDNIVSIGTSTKVQIAYTLITEPYREDYLKSIEPGKQLAEDKKFLTGEVTAVEVVDYMVSAIDNNGDIIVGVHPYEKKAIIKVIAEVDYKEPIYKLGKQEIRVGARVFLTTEDFNLSTTVTKMQEVE